jgi:cellulose synthase/poly-beta-1,6-N-acetylglucosamine synthase-like glycosyltransferase
MSGDTVSSTADADLPGVSVVVVGRNEGERLARCLESVRASHYPADCIEIIYVDSNSTDGSGERAEALGARVIVIAPERPCAAAGRNAGWRQASHELVHFLDGDTVLDVDWLGKAVRAMADPQAACVAGRRREVAPQATVYNFWMDCDWPSGSGPVESCAGDALFRRWVLDKEGGFDETLIAGEEPDLCFRIRDRLGMTVLQLDEPMTLHDANMTRFSEYWRRCFRTGHAYAEVGGRYKRYTRWRRNRWRVMIHAGLPIVAGILSLVLRSFWPIVVWVALIAAVVMRSTWRQRERIGSWRGSFVYSLHLVLSKWPTAMGQCDYWLRCWTRREPRSLIEYRATDTGSSE